MMNEPSEIGPLYDWWRDAAYKGVYGEVDESNARLGRYRIRRRNEAWIPVSIELRSPVDPETGELDGDETVTAIVGFKGATAEMDPHKVFGKDPNHPKTLWLMIADKAVTAEAFDQAYETGKWPDDAPGSNFGPQDDSFEGLCEQLTNAIGFAEQFQEVATKDKADQAANLKDRIFDIHKRLEAMRRAEKKPYDDGAQAVQNKFNPPLGKAILWVDKLRDALKPYLSRVMEEAKAAVVNAGGSPAQVEIKARVGGMAGKRTAPKKVKVCIIDDFEKAYTHVREDPDLRDYAVKVIERRVKAGEPIPGARMVEEMKVI